MSAVVIAVLILVATLAAMSIEGELLGAPPWVLEATFALGLAVAAFAGIVVG